MPTELVGLIEAAIEQFEILGPELIDAYRWDVLSLDAINEAAGRRVLEVDGDTLRVYSPSGRSVAFTRRPAGSWEPSAATPRKLARACEYLEQHLAATAKAEQPQQKQAKRGPGRPAGKNKSRNENWADRVDAGEKPTDLAVEYDCDPSTVRRGIADHRKSRQKRPQ